MRKTSTAPTEICLMQQTGPQLPVLALKPDNSHSPWPRQICVFGKKPTGHTTKQVTYNNILSQNNNLSLPGQQSRNSSTREATNTTLIFLNDNRNSCESIIPAAFNERHPLYQRRLQLFNFQQSTSQDALETREHLLILMKEANVDRMGQEDIACMMMQNCFLDTALKAELGAVKTPTCTKKTCSHLPPN